MKRSTWRFKRSLSIKPAGVNSDLFLALTLLSIVTVASCQLSHSNNVDTAQTGSGGEPVASAPAVMPLALTPPMSPAEGDGDTDGRLAVHMLGDGRLPLADVVVPDCAAPPASLELHLRSTIVSDYGSFPVRFHVRGDGAGETVRADVDGYRLSFGGVAAVKTRIAAAACAAAAAGTKEFVAEPLLVAETREWIELVAPDCDKITATHAGWQCGLPGIDAEAARQELIGIQTTMIRRWSRQPYLLARRLAVGITLAHALEAPNPDKALATFCNIVLASLPIELPATIASERWQTAVCGKDAPRRFDAARFGLAKTIAEVDFMRQLFERTSRLGFLAVHIPPSKAPAHEMLVSLTPEADVADNLTRETAHLWLTDSSDTATPEDLPRSCWHPVYAERPALLDLARHLAMAGEAARVVCETDPALKPPALATERYFAESITSETEFVIANGRSKTLRLPIGKYSYTLRGLPENPDDWDDASQARPQATGEIVWDAKRPRPVISVW